MWSSFCIQYVKSVATEDLNDRGRTRAFFTKQDHEDE